MDKSRSTQVARKVQFEDIKNILDNPALSRDEVEEIILESMAEYCEQSIDLITFLKLINILNNHDNPIFTPELREVIAQLASITTHTDSEVIYDILSDVLKKITRI